MTCNFWHWELEYVEYLVAKHFIVGDAAVDAIGAAEERREELLKAQELVQMNESTSRCNKATSYGMSRQKALALLMLGKELVKLMKMLFGAMLVLGLGCIVLIWMK